MKKVRLPVGNGDVLAVAIYGVPPHLAAQGVKPYKHMVTVEDGHVYVNDDVTRIDVVEKLKGSVKGELVAQLIRDEDGCWEANVSPHGD